VKSSPKSIYFLKSNSSRNQKRPKQSRFKKPKQTQKKKNQSWSLKTRNHMIKKRKEMLKAMNMEEKKKRERKSTCLREEITTEAPSNPNLSAMEKPIPWVEAVTITTFPSNLFPLIILLVILPSLISLSCLQITRQDKLQKQSWFLKEILLLLWLMKQISDNLKIY